MTGLPRPAGPPGTAPRGPAGTRPARRQRHPRTPESLARGFVILFLEVEAGLRPRRHLFPLMCPVLVLRMSGTWVRPGPSGVLVSLHGKQLAAGAFEAVAVVRRGPRFGAIGVRLVRRETGWRVEEVARPELGPLPPAAYIVPLDEPDEAGEQQEAAGRRRSLQRATSRESV